MSKYANYKNDQVFLDGMLHKIGVMDRVFYFSGTGWHQSTKEPEVIIKALEEKRNPKPAKELKKPGPKPKNREIV